MDKETLLKIYQSELYLNKGVLCCGSSLLVRGIKKHTRDVDIAITSCSTGMFQYHVTNSEIFTGKHNIKDGIKFHFGTVEFEAYSNRIHNSHLPKIEWEWVGNVRAQTLKSIIEWKTVFGREKDLIDIAMIQEYIKNNK